MRILAWVHLYPPNHCAGAEMMLHEILLGMMQRGHQVAVICNANPVDQFEGVPIFTADRIATTELVEWSQVMITHLDKTRDVVRAVGRGRPPLLRRPLVHLVHNDRQLASHRVAPRDAQLVVANSEWIREAIGWRGECIVVRPPVTASRYCTPRDKAGSITLINLNKAKGVETFWKLVNRMPGHRFLGVVGGYYAQDIPKRLPPNATIVEHGPDINAVYERTRILLCPSDYESWGRVGIEAAASGIPTIANPTPGLLESLGASGTFVDKADTDGWVRAITALDDPAAYAKASAAALARSAELDPAEDLDLLEQHLDALVHQWAARR